MKHSFAHGLRSGLCLLLALLMVLSVPATALAAAKDDYCADGYTKAEKIVEEAITYGGYASAIVEIIEDQLLNNDDVKSFFTGTGSQYESIIVSVISSKLADYPDLIAEMGLGHLSNDVIAQEFYDAACIYYDHVNKNNGTVNEAQKLAKLELLRYILMNTSKTLVITKPTSSKDAESVAAEYYDYYSQTEAKALEAAVAKYAKKHTFADGKCSSCGAKDPNAGSGTPTDPTTPSTPTEPSDPTVPTTEPTCAHSYGNVKWTWADDDSYAYITKRCSICDDVVKSEATISTKVIKAATCTTDGSTEFTGTASMDGKTYTYSKTETVAALGHDFDMKWTWEGTTAATVSYTCQNDKTHTGTATATVTTATTNPTCTADGKTVHTASVTIDGVAYTDAKTETIAATGHTYDVENATWSWSGTRSATVTVKCSVCNSSTRGRATITNAVTTEPTCGAEGVRTYTATATVNGVELTDAKTEAIAKLDEHTFADGKCTVCGEADPDYVAPPTTEPPVTEPPVTEPPHTHSYTTKVTAPTCTEKGYTTYTCSCGDTYTGNEVAATGHSFGAWVIVKDASSKEVGKEERACACGEKETRDIAKLTNKFTDVKATDYYYEPVLWAVNKGITAGTSTTTFGPATPCTRAQVVTFLWRTAGSPEPKATSTTFTDVKAGDYYYKAVLWAVEEGITSGMSATSFGSSYICTRAQVVTFLWRAAGSPEAKNTTSTFADVKSTDYYCKAVLWAVEEGITAGMSATSFGSTTNCTRGQIVTFLYKAYVK